MSGISALVNNFDLILENQHEILDHAPYRCSRLRLRMMRPLGKCYIGDNHTSIFDCHLGGYLMVWENFLERWGGSDILPLRGAGSPLSGHVADFVGYSMNNGRFTREKPDGFTTGAMLRYLNNFRKMFPEKELAVPLEQVVRELKEGRPIEERESYQLLTLREDFRRTVTIISEIESGGEERISYNLVQDRFCMPVIKVDTVLELELTDDERRRFALNGTAVYVADMIRESIEKLRQLAASYGFVMEKQQQLGNMAALEFSRTLNDHSRVLETTTVQQVVTFLNDVKRLRTRF